tara:strand:+ start:360 stop:749 length:390 start_codon:yes stop_codon:yes gene_type:complete
LEHLSNLKDVILITSGAVIGANTRFIVFRKLEKINLINNHIILVINTFSSFLLGLFLSISSRIGSFTYTYQSGLFFSIGLLGSLSTFSTFVYDLFDLAIKSKFFTALKLFALSFSLGMIALAFGFLLGN